jgi:regulator of protease activity HflC (stomatin/prohibitin superfamily)
MTDLGAALLKVGLLVLFVGLFVFGAFYFMCTSNPETPAGYVGYVTQGAIFGQTKFYGIQHGPASPGRGWFLHVVNASVTPYSYPESFQDNNAVLSQDNLKVGFNVYLIFQIDAEDNAAKQFFEKYSLLDPKDTPDVVVEKAYGNYLREPLRTAGRVEVQKYKAFEVKSHITEIGLIIEKQIRALAAGTPFKIISVVVGNITYDSKITDAISEKLAASQNLERYATMKEIETKKAEIRVIEANGIAQAMEKIQTKLTPLYLQHEAIEAQKLMVGSPNHTTIYVPVGAMGVPLVQTPPVSK